MPGVAHNKTNLLSFGELKSRYDVLRLGSFDRVRNVVAQSARDAPIGEWIAALIGKVRLHDRVGRWGAAKSIRVLPQHVNGALALTVSAG